MSQVPASHEALSAKDSAIANMVPDHDTIRDELNTLFEARQRMRDRIAEIRKQDEATAIKTMLIEDRAYEPEALAIISRLRTLQMRSPYKAARTYFQVMIGCNALGLDKNVEAPPPKGEESGPVFDRTTSGRRQGGNRFGPEAEQLLRQAGDNVAKTTVSTRLLSEFLELISKALPIPKGKGRPSNVFLTTERYAWDLVEFARERATEAGEDIGNAEAAGRIAFYIDQGINPLAIRQHYRWPPQDDQAS